MNAHVTAEIVPRYEIENGGTHDDSFGSDHSVKVKPMGATTVSLDDGEPEGIEPGAAISECTPRLLDIDVTNS